MFLLKRIQGFYVSSNMRLMPMSLNLPLAASSFVEMMFTQASYSCREFGLFILNLKDGKPNSQFSMSIIHIFMGISYCMSTYIFKHVKFIHWK
jgi:hypothetical protein